MFPVMINPQLKINLLYDIGAVRTCMNYETLFKLGLDLDDKAVPHYAYCFKELIWVLSGLQD